MALKLSLLLGMHSGLLSKCYDECLWEKKIFVLYSCMHKLFKLNQVLVYMQKFTVILQGQENNCKENKVKHTNVQKYVIILAKRNEWKTEINHSTHVYDSFSAITLRGCSKKSSSSLGCVKV